MSQGRALPAGGLSRRRFLATLPALGGLAAVPMGVYRAAAAGNPPARVLVCVQLAGGNDSLNMVVPYADPWYLRSRPGIGLRGAQLLPLDAHLALNAHMPELRVLYGRGELAVVNQVGYPGLRYGHAAARAVYERADPSGKSHGEDAGLRGGWLGRAMAGMVAAQVAGGTLADPLPGCAIDGLAGALQAPGYAPALLPADPTTFVLPAYDAQQLQVLQRMAALGVDGGAARNAAQAALATLFQARGAETGAAGLGAAAGYPRTGIGQDLMGAALLLRADPAVRVLTLTMPGFDTHSAATDHGALLGQLSAALGAFIADLQAHGQAGRVAVLVWSEFSRRVHENASGGTDHGGAQSLLLLGAGVRGGLYGGVPDLSPGALVDGGNLPMAVDFRSVYASLLQGWLGLDPVAVLGGTFPLLPLLV